MVRVTRNTPPDASRTVLDERSLLEDTSRPPDDLADHTGRPHVLSHDLTASQTVSREPKHANMIRNGKTRDPSVRNRVPVAPDFCRMRHDFSQNGSPFRLSAPGTVQSPQCPIEDMTTVRGRFATDVRDMPKVPITGCVEL